LKFGKDISISKHKNHLLALSIIIDYFLPVISSSSATDRKFQDQ